MQVPDLIWTYQITLIVNIDTAFCGCTSNHSCLE
jgi:hypothetical protein